ncbi:MAG: hypothetical protein ACPIOQ_52945, partial [Promethearchaeia archaeon]
ETRLDCSVCTPDTRAKQPTQEQSSRNAADLIQHIACLHGAITVLALAGARQPNRSRPVSAVAV